MWSVKLTETGQIWLLKNDGEDMLELTKEEFDELVTFIYEHYKDE